MKTFAFLHVPILMVSILLSSSAGAQESVDTAGGNPVYSLGADVGLNDFHVKDNYLSPDIFRGSMFSARLAFERRSPESLHEIRIGFSSGAINSDIQPIDAAEIVGSLSYAYERSVQRFDVAGRPMATFLGLGISSFMAGTTHFDKIEMWSSYDDGSWYWSHSVDLLARLEFTPDGERSLSVRVQLPAFRIVSRPENGHDKNPRNEEVSDNNLKAATGGRPEYLWDNLVIHSEVEFKQPISNSLDLNAAYTFTYASSNRPLAMLSYGMFMNQFHVGIMWRL